MKGAFLMPMSVSLMLGLAACHQQASPASRGPQAAITPATNPTAAALLAPSAATVQPAPPLVAAGEQARWTVIVHSQSAEIKVADGLDEIFPMPAARVGSTSWSFGGGAHSAALRLAEAACTSADKGAWSRTAEVLIDGRTYGGCAVPLSRDGDVSSNAVYGLLGGMRTCLRRAQTDDAVLLWADKGADGEMLARVRTGDGSQFDCSADAVGDRLKSFQPSVEKNDREKATIAGFALTAAGFNSLRCELAPATVLSALGEVVGYLQLGACGEAPSAAPLPKDN